MKYFFAASLLLFALFSNAQLDPVAWEASLIHIEGDNYELQITAEIEDKWVIYSQHLDDDGPIPTTFTVDANENLKLVGGFEEPNDPIIEMDDMFGMKLTKFKGTSTFVQKVKISNSQKEVKGSIEFMTCDSKRCLPPKTVTYTASIN